MTADGPPKQHQNFLGGFKLTLEHLGRPPVTRQYPEEKRPKQPRQHGRHVLNKYEDGMEKCIGCELCAGVCPADCIYVRGLDNPLDHPVSPGERYGYIYEINFLRCIHCDMCVEACPTEAITETKLMEFSFTNRNDAIYTKDELLVDDEGRPRHLPWEDWREEDHLHTSGWMRATSPSGSAAYEGQVQWSGELGFGVRAPEGGQSGLRDDATTGSRQLRDTLERHLRPSDLPASKRGARGAIGRMIEKAERFAPGAGRKHRVRADSEYAASLAAGNTESAVSAASQPALPGQGGMSAGSAAATDAGSDR
ncbi:MAG: NADH-quinone oxidoreductase subunit NuoI [Acidimicrobiales bacterium]